MLKTKVRKTSFFCLCWTFARLK